MGKRGPYPSHEGEENLNQVAVTQQLNTTDLSVALLCATAESRPNEEQIFSPHYGCLYSRGSIALRPERPACGVENFVSKIWKLTGFLNPWACPPIAAEGIKVVQINGNNGEWTNGDDLADKAIVKRLEKKGQKAKVKAKRTEQLSKQKKYIEEKMAKGPKARARVEKSIGSSRVIRGRGDYELGRNVGSKVGGWIGEKLHGWFSSLFGGSGDYQMHNGFPAVKSNSFLSGGTSIPSMHSDNGGGIVVSFHEYLGDISMTEEFTLRSYDINPINETSFPWLNVIAGNFMQYTLRGAVYCFVTNSSDVVSAPTQGMGSISGSIRYDVDSEPPGNLEEMLNSYFAASAKPSVNQAFPVECARDQTIVPVMKIQQPGVTPGDLQFYTFGVLDIATQDAPNAYTGAGKLYVTYEVEFFKPRMSSSPGTAPMFMMDFTGLTVATYFTPVADTIAVKQPRINSLGLVVDPSFVGRYVFPLSTPTGATYLLYYANLGTATANHAVVSLSYGGGMAAAYSLIDQAIQTLPEPLTSTNGSSGAATVFASFKYDGTGTQIAPPYIQLTTSGATPIAASNGATVIIVRIDPKISTGLTLRKPIVYTRKQFCRYLLDTIAGRSSKSAPPDEVNARLIDWVKQFDRTSSWILSNPLPRAQQPFDITLLEALTSISRYTGIVEDVDECKDDDSEYEEVVVRRPKQKGVVIRSQLNGANGEVTGKDDVDGSLEFLFEIESDDDEAFQASPLSQGKLIPRLLSYNNPSPVHCVPKRGPGKRFERALSYMRDLLSQSLTQFFPVVVATIVRSYTDPLCGYCLDLYDHPPFLNIVGRVVESACPCGCALTCTRTGCQGVKRKNTGCKCFEIECLRAYCTGEVVTDTNIYETRMLAAILAAQRRPNPYVLAVLECTRKLLLQNIHTKEFDAQCAANVHALSQINGSHGEYTNGDDLAQQYTACYAEPCTLSGGRHLHKKKSDNPERKYSQALRRIVESKNAEVAKSKGEANKPRKPIQSYECELTYPDCKIVEHGHALNDQSIFRMECKGDDITLFEVQTQSRNDDDTCNNCWRRVPAKNLNYGICLECTMAIIEVGEPGFVEKQPITVMVRSESKWATVLKKDGSSLKSLRVTSEGKEIKEQNSFAPVLTEELLNPCVPVPLKNGCTRKDEILVNGVWSPFLGPDGEAIDYGLSLFDDSKVDVCPTPFLEDLSAFEIKTPHPSPKNSKIIPIPKLKKEIRKKEKRKSGVESRVVLLRSLNFQPPPSLPRLARGHGGFCSCNHCPEALAPRPRTPFKRGYCQKIDCWQKGVCLLHGRIRAPAFPPGGQHTPAQLTLARWKHVDREKLVRLDEAPPFPDGFWDPKMRCFSSPPILRAEDRTVPVEGKVFGSTYECHPLLWRPPSGKVYVLDDVFPDYTSIVKGAWREHFDYNPVHPDLPEEISTEVDGRTRDVIVYYTVDPRKTYTLYQRMANFCKDHAPFLQKGVGYTLNDNNGLTASETLFIKSHSTSTYTWGLPWSPYWNKEASYTSPKMSDFAFLGLAYYQSCASVPIFTELYDYLYEVSEKRVNDLHSRIFVRSVEKSGGSVEIVASAVAAVKTVALKYEFAGELFKLEPRVFCNTLHHFVQQSIVQGLRDLAAVTPVTGIAFGSWGSR